MKKVIAFVLVCGFAVAFVSCGSKQAEQATDAAVTAVDSTVQKLDSAGNAIVDTVKAAVN
ncbi:MAG: hypothetical protein K2U26_09140 [Cyclobacteriaceae bacterium]|nr:hypothetical protein [Cyclobacteriaceae bacterium]